MKKLVNRKMSVVLERGKYFRVKNFNRVRDLLTNYIERKHRN